MCNPCNECGVFLIKNALSRPQEWYAVASAALRALAQPSRMGLRIRRGRVVAVNLAGCHGNRGGERAEKHKRQREAA